MPWSDQHVVTLKTLWGDGLSTGQIARKLGAGYSREAVTGKLHRLGLLGNSKTLQVTKSGPAAAEPRRSSPSTAAPELPQPPLRTAEVVPKNITLMDLAKRSCRWPTGKREGEQLFCGLVQDETLEPYCKAHGEIAFSPAALRIKWDRAIRRNGAVRR